jgi:hypothetical protein
MSYNLSNSGDNMLSTCALNIGHQRAVMMLVDVLDTSRNVEMAFSTTDDTGNEFAAATHVEDGRSRI